MTKRKIKGKTKRVTVVLAVLAALAIIAASVSAVYIFWDDIHEGDPSAFVLGDGEVSVHFIDVGQADSALVMTNDGCMLVDAGTTSSEPELYSYLSDMGVESLEYLVLTHPHDDHMGGADMVIERFEVENVVMMDNYSDEPMCVELLSLIDEHDVNVITPESGYTFYVGECLNTVLAPNKPCEEYDETNSTSIVIKCEFGESSFLFTGDAEEDSELEMIEKYGDMLDCDILKLGHHGSKTSSSFEFLRITSPEYAIACCGEDNTYGHPAAIVQYRLDVLGIELLRTDKCGSIVFISDGQNIKCTDK